MMSKAARAASARLAAKARKASRLGAMRSAQIKRIIALDAKIDKLRALQKSAQFKIDNIDRVINSLGYGG